MISFLFGGLFPLIIGSVVSQLLQQDTYNYCDPKLKLCEVAEDHTMCKYPVPGLSPQCTPAIHEPLSATEKKRILFWHNKFRSNVANGTERNKNRKLPTSSNMRQMYWDKELEMIAARWAEQCSSSTDQKIYDKCRNTKRFQVSQNVGMRRVNGTFIDKQAPQIIITWYKESKDFDPDLVDKFDPIHDVKTSTKQFANIIWAETYAIGCARIIFHEELPLIEKEPKKTSMWTIERLVCNYGPGGNEMGKPVYKRGISCEDCPDGTLCSRVFPGLCAIQSAEKLENIQNLENQESKEDAKAETETSAPETNSSLTSGILASERSRTEETLLEEDEEGKAYSPKSSFPEVKPHEEKKNSTGSCEAQGCSGGKDEAFGKKGPGDTGDRFDEIIEFSKPTARKKPQRFKKEVLSQEKETEIINKGKEKWTDGTGRKRTEKGRFCECYVAVDTPKNGISPKETCFFSFVIFFFFYAFLHCALKFHQ